MDQPKNLSVSEEDVKKAEATKGEANVYFKSKLVAITFIGYFYKPCLLRSYNAQHKLCNAYILLLDYL